MEAQAQQNAAGRARTDGKLEVQSSATTAACTVLVRLLFPSAATVTKPACRSLGQYAGLGTQTRPLVDRVLVAWKMY
ncbi:MAG TPA: hypothetical protein VG649_10435 [Candidatus Angelobacter sp.]|nr:hypothetical protein [Candidatus Angelobacter sp.]